MLEEQDGLGLGLGGGGVTVWVGDESSKYCKVERVVLGSHPYATITFLCKKGSPSSALNHNPISVSCCMSTITPATHGKTPLDGHAPTSGRQPQKPHHPGTGTESLDFITCSQRKSTHMLAGYC